MRNIIYGRRTTKPKILSSTTFTRAVNSNLRSREEIQIQKKQTPVVNAKGHFKILSKLTSSISSCVSEFGERNMSACGIAVQDMAGSLRLPPPQWDFRGTHLPSTSVPPSEFSPRCTSFNKCFPSFGWSQVGTCTDIYRLKRFKVKASETPGRDRSPVAPVHLESPAGQLLSQIMQTHPHLLPAAIDQQLERLQEERDMQTSEKPPSLQDLLYRRMAEIKEKDRKKTLEEIIYCLVVQKFMDKNISMIPAVISSSDPLLPVDSWPNQEHKFETVHSPDALEMIQSHLSLILGERSVGPLSSIVQISKVKLGKLYAASIMYGYFLKRVDQRFQLERTMKTVPERVGDSKIFESLKSNPFWDMESMVQISPNDEYVNAEDITNFGGEARLRTYVMHLDPDTLQRYATMRSKEAISLIEKQTQALFGRPDIRVGDDGSIDVSNDEIIAITFIGLTMLVLEAVAFGSFLWDTEGYVESKYHIFSS